MYKILILIFWSVNVFAQAVTTEVSETRVNADDTVEFSIVVEGSADDLDEALEKYQKVISPYFAVVGQSTSQSFSSDFSKIKRTSRIALTLQPQKSGVLTLPAFTLNFKGKLESSLPIQITVQGGQPPLNQGSQGATQAPQSQAPVSIEYRLPGKKFLYSEPIPVEVKIFARSRVRNISHPGQSSPEFRVIAIPGDQQKEEIINGEQMLVVTLRQILIPIKTGEVTTPVFSADVTFEKQNKMAKNFPFGNFFGNFSEVVSKKISSESSVVTIEPLPKPIPQNFKDAYGEFEFKLSASNSKVTVGDTLTYTVTLEGEGVLDSVKELRLPEIFYTHGRVFAEKATLEEKPNAQGIISKRIQKYAFIPTKEFEIKKDALNLKLDTFNFKSKKYETLSQTIPELQVIKSTAVEESPAPTSSPAAISPNPTISLSNESLQNPATLFDKKVLMAFGTILFILGGATAVGIIYFMRMRRRFTLRSAKFNPYLKNIKKAKSHNELDFSLKDFLAFHFKANPKAWTQDDFHKRLEQYSTGIHQLVLSHENVDLKKLKKDIARLIDEHTLS